MKSAAKRRDATDARDVICRRIEELAAARGLSLAKISGLLGANEAYMQQFIHRGSPDELDLDQRVRLATILHCSVDDVTVDKSRNDWIKDSAKKLGTKPFNLLTQEGWIPLRGKPTKSGHIDFRPEDREAKRRSSGTGARMTIPSLLTGARDAYATEMPDAKLEPAIPQGALCFINNPAEPPVEGDAVVVHLKGGLGLIRILVKLYEDRIVVAQLNPKSINSIVMDEIEAIHVVAANTRRQVKF